jgi:hypothetical protein
MVTRLCGHFSGHCNQFGYRYKLGAADAQLF